MQPFALTPPEETTPQRVASARRGVLLINLGTPDEPDVASVRRYLTEFLGDPSVIQLPTGFGWLTGLLGKTIARFRAAKSAEAYSQIWTDRGSPLKVITEDQTEALQAVMPPGWKVFYAMRYGSPSIAKVLRDVREAGIKELVIVSMYPQYSGPTTGTAQREVSKCLLEVPHQFEVTTRMVWNDDHGYIKAQTALIASYAKSEGLTPENSFLLFSTHGLPTSYVRAGDPYPEQIARTVALVGHQLGWPADRMSLAYQSRLGPVEWLTPATDTVLTDLTCAGEKNILVCPISFTVDCLETIEEIGLRYREDVEATGAALHLCPALNTFPPFINALKHLVLQGATPMTNSVATPRSAEPTTTLTAGDDHIESLMMVGVSAAGRLGHGLGPDLAHVPAGVLQQIKRPQREVPKLLKQIRAASGLSEAFLWNTCHRFELYGWGNSETAEAVKQQLFRAGLPDGLTVNVLRGRDALHHLLRTAMGLNSHLPGERDVLDQLKAAHRLAACAGASGSRASRLLADMTKLDEELRSDTAWRTMDLDYCTAAFSRIVSSGQADFHKGRVVVIGGSTTSAAALRTLRNRYDVPAEQLTILYRGHKHGGQIKLLRQAIGTGLRLRIESYDEPRVRRIISEADLLIFGLDRKEPIITAAQLQGARDFTNQPLTVFDFNMFGSTVGLDEIDGVTVFNAKHLHTEVETFANEICERADFAEAVETVEARLAEFASKTRVDSPSTTQAVTAPMSVSKANVPHKTGSANAVATAMEGEHVR